MDTWLMDTKGLRLLRNFKKVMPEITVGDVEIGANMRGLDENRYRNLNDENLAIYNGLTLLGLLRGYPRIPEWASNFIVNKKGRIGHFLRRVYGRMNNRERTVTVLQRAELRSGERAEVSGKLLKVLGHHSKESSQLIDEIVEKRGEVSEADLRSTLRNCTHAELAWFRSKLD